MVLLSVLTPVLALILCLVLGFMLVQSRGSEATSTEKNKGATKGDFRPWVDQDLQDDTEVGAEGEGEKTKNEGFYHLQAIMRSKIECRSILSN